MTQSSAPAEDPCFSCPCKLDDCACLRTEEFYCQKLAEENKAKKKDLENIPVNFDAVETD